MPGVSALPVRTGRVRASAGKSHSWLTPTTRSPAPSANRISVPLGTSETIRMVEILGDKAAENHQGPQGQQGLQGLSGSSGAHPVLLFVSLESLLSLLSLVIFSRGPPPSNSRRRRAPGPWANGRCG